MEESRNVKTDHLFRQLGGCGIFQYIHGICISLAQISMVLSVIFMVFGNYNPGWKCMDNTMTTTAATNTTIFTSTPSNTSPLQEDNGSFTTQDGFGHTCEGFSECRNVVFNPETKTIATEWGLICDYIWIGGIMFTLQMAGGTVGTLVGGYLSDAYGRKLIFYINLFVQGVLTLVSVLSPRWQMFAVLRFFIGLSQGMAMCISYVYIMEFSAPKWRVVVSSLPLWGLGCILFFSCALALKNWVYLHIVCGVFMLFCVLPVFVLPESLRWLLIKNKLEKALNAIRKIAKINRVGGPSEKLMDRLEGQQQSEQSRHTQSWKNNIYNFIRLFHMGTLKHTIVLAAMFFSFNFIYFTTTFGIIALSGDFYINNIIVYATELPANVIVIFIANTFGRKPSGCVSNIGQAISFFICVAFDRLVTGSAQANGIFAFVILARICLSMNWYIGYTCTCELYPTVMRTVAIAWIVFWSGIGSAISPHVIKIEPGSKYMFFIVMGVLSLAISALYCLLPETKGKDLKDDIDSETGSDEEMTDNVDI